MPPSIPIQTPTCHLLAVPREIRDIIYQHLLPQRSEIWPRVTLLFNQASQIESSKRQLKPHADDILVLAQTCQFLHDEVLQIYYGTNEFAFESTHDLYCYLYMIGPERRPFIQKLFFVYRNPCYHSEAFKMLGECKNLRELRIAVLAQTTKGCKEPQKDLFKAKGVASLRKIRGLGNLLKLDVVEVYNHFSSRRFYRVEGWPLAAAKDLHFEPAHLQEFAKIVGEEMRKEEPERVKTKREERAKAKSWRSTAATKGSRSSSRIQKSNVSSTKVNGRSRGRGTGKKTRGKKSIDL